MNANPKVSVLVPVYNMERYLAQCLDALCGQTLEDIEIIAVNDGSTDSSGDILARYAAADERIRVISKPNSGYGASMNRGLDEARGEFVGIVEPDDYPDLVMFEKLYRAAVKHDCDLVKCNYYEHFETHESIMRTFDGFSYATPFCPADQPRVICTIPSIWTGLYRRSMLEDAGIRFRETPGAAFQDTGFTMKAWFAADRAVLVRRPLLHYRMDNPGSSVKTMDKALTVCEELAEAEAFLRARPLRCGAFIPWFNVDKWGKYRWNYGRIDASLRREFAQRMYGEYAEARDAGELALGLFGENSRLQVARLLVEGPQAFIAAYPDALPWDWEDDPVAAGVPEAAAAFAREGVQALDLPASPVITVIVAAYNCEKYVGECLESLKAQTFADFEAVVVDDASTDATVRVVRAHIAGDDRFRLIERAENGGPGAARNAALDVARGTYVMYVDADDGLVSHALEHIAAKAVRQSLDEMYFSAQSYYEDNAAIEALNEDFSGRVPFEGVATGRELFAFFSDRGQYFPQGALHLVRRELLEREGIRFPEGVIHEDVLFDFRIHMAAERSSFLNEPLYLRRQRVGSIMDSARRSAENVRGHVTAIMFIRSWVRTHAAELDPAFIRAIGREVGQWSQLVAHDWEHEMAPGERTAFAEWFAGQYGEGELATLLFDIVGMGDASERAAAEWRESLTYKLGDAIATVPRAARSRLSAALGRMKIREQS